MYVRGESRAFFPNKIDNQYVYAEGFLRLTVTANDAVHPLVSLYTVFIKLCHIRTTADENCA